MSLRRILPLVASSVLLVILRCADAFVVVSPRPLPALRSPDRRQQEVLLYAAPGVKVASPDLLRGVLQDGTTTVVDARSLEELQENGFFRCAKCKWIHAPATPSGAPLMELASGYLIPDKEATVVVYCASGIRSEATKKVLEEAGYASVLNAGGLSDLDFLKE